MSSRGDLRDGIVAVTLTINGRACKLAVEPRVTLLDALREELADRHEEGLRSG